VLDRSPIILSSRCTAYPACKAQYESCLVNRSV